MKKDAHILKHANRWWCVQGPTAFAFTPNNPTGHHRLDLSIKEERDVGIKILDARNGNEDYLEAFRKKYSAHAGGPRDHIELCWRNATMNGEVHTHICGGGRLPEPPEYL
jgi:hypothetical protein